MVHCTLGQSYASTLQLLFTRHVYEPAVSTLSPIAAENSRDAVL